MTEYELLEIVRNKFTDFKIELKFHTKYVFFFTKEYKPLKQNYSIGFPSLTRNIQIDPMTNNVIGFEKEFDEDVEHIFSDKPFEDFINFVLKLEKI